MDHLPVVRLRVAGVEVCVCVGGGGISEWPPIDHGGKSYAVV